MGNVKMKNETEQNRTEQNEKKERRKERWKEFFDNCVFATTIYQKKYKARGWNRGEKKGRI